MFELCETNLAVFVIISDEVGNRKSYVVELFQRTCHSLQCSAIIDMGEPLYEPLLLQLRPTEFIYPPVDWTLQRAMAVLLLQLIVLLQVVVLTVVFVATLKTWNVTPSFY